MFVMKKFLFRTIAAVCVTSLGAAAANAGTITAYTSLEEDDVRIYLESFSASHPDITVNVLRLSTGDLGARMLAEKSNPQHDLIWGWAVTQMVDPRILEMVEPYAPNGIDKVNDVYKDADGRWFATTGYLAGFCVNKEVLEKKGLPMPTSWQDLLSPVYKGELVMPNPASSGTGYLQIASLLQMKGEEEGWKFLEELDKNMAQYIKSGSKPCKVAAAGEYAIGASFAFSAIKQIIEGYPLALVIPSEGAGYELEASALMKTSGNKEDAKKFLDWLLTLDAAKLYAERAAMSSVPGARAPDEVLAAGLPEDVPSVLYRMDFDWSAANKERILAEWQKRIER
ncbi:MAG TPA: extracellular solute-binding protein [Thermomicrobiales bacterium]|nr:extracellular solute-binding protein [Thermomicrobiales bacterium]